MGKKLVHQQFLQDENGDDINVKAFTSGTAVFSRPINTSYNEGFSSLLLVQGTGTLDMDVSYELSLDGSIWFEPSTTDGASLTTTGAIATAVTESEWIIYTPQVAPFTRFKLDPDATGSWTVHYVHQERGN